MPHHKHHKNQKLNREEVVQNLPRDANANMHGEGNINEHRQRRNGQATSTECCVPSACLCQGETINPSDPDDAVRVYCNNEACTMGNWMHKECFMQWEDTVLAYLKSCGRARSWSEKQRLQNLWTKKGYDLAFKACDCKCGRGHLRKDLNYVPPPRNDNAAKAKKKHKKKNDKPVAVVSNGKPVPATNGNANQSQTNNNSNAVSHAITNHLNNVNNNAQRATERVDNAGRCQLIRSSPIDTPVTEEGGRSIRMRANSCESTGSSPPNSSASTGSASPAPVSPSPSSNDNFPIKAPRPKFDFPPETNNFGMSIFRRRPDLSAFNVLPKHKLNPYHIKMEDDIPQGNDEIRTFVHTHLSTYKVSSMNCVLCKNMLPVFDRYPMIDGTFFLSPQAYDDSVVQVISDGRLQFINAVCVGCLEGGSDVRCAACKRKWDGSALLLGTMYSYDIFAAMPCCQKRLTCKQCRRAVVDVTTGLNFFSDYSRMIACPYCKAYDYHFIRPMADTFAVKQPIWN
ncbi:hypothetical protein FSP39_021061 [Pinctada imbricata]|uniref:Headcase middle domain-containing protein n=1 Tax=Pinctada imbricata TaxID=66713 RepID=A0AA89C2A2_PINIB|nr:hypothetical protein FSP39_021061 [Pinctada imbricata]